MRILTRNEITGNLLFFLSRADLFFKNRNSIEGELLKETIASAV